MVIFDIEPGNQAVFAGEQILQQNLGQAKVSTGFAGFSARLAVGQASAEARTFLPFRSKTCSS